MASWDPDLFEDYQPATRVVQAAQVDLVAMRSLTGANPERTAGERLSRWAARWHGRAGQTGRDGTGRHRARPGIRVHTEALTLPDPVSASTDRTQTAGAAMAKLV